MILRDPYGNNGKTLAEMVARRCGWQMGHNGEGRVPKIWTQCGFASTFSGSDTIRMILSSRVGSCNYSGKGNPDDGVSPEILWDLRAKLWPTVRAALERRGQEFANAAARLETERAEVEAAYGEHGSDKQVKGLSYPANTTELVDLGLVPAWKDPLKKNKDAPPNAYLGSYHPHKDEARTVDVLNVSLGYDCAWVMHLDEKVRCTREVLMGENHQRSKQAFLDGKPMSGWRPCRGCTTFTLRSGDLVWFEGAKVVHGVGYCYPGEQPDWTPSWLKNRRVSIGMRLERGNREEVQ